MPSMIEVTIGILTGLFVIATGAAITMIMQQRKQARLIRERARSEEQAAAATSSRDAAFSRTVHRLGEKASSGTASRGLRERLAMAGYHAESAASTFLGYKIVLLVLGSVGTAAAALPLPIGGQIKLLLIAVVAGICFLIPDLIVQMKRGRRRAEVEHHLPDAIDLLEICVSSGMGLDMAWNAVADEMRRVNATLADEMDLTNLELSLGVGRAVAMRHMADRTGAAEISSLVALLVQSERFGASVVDALRTFADTMRESRSARAEESAEKMTVKLLFPMVLFIFPPLLIVMVGPAMVELAGVIFSK